MECMGEFIINADVVDMVAIIMRVIISITTIIAFVLINIMFTDREWLKEKGKGKKGGI